MLGKCVHYVSGIVCKQLIKVDQHKGIDFYMLLSDYKKQDGFMRIYFQHNEHFFPISSDIEHIKQYLDNNPEFNMQDMIVEDFEKSIIKGASINKGYAQYLNREQEALEAVERFRMEKEQQRAEQEAIKEEEERLRLLEHEKTVQYAEQAFINHEYIYGDIFLDICNKHGISVPIRTKGWIRENLTEIKCNENMTVSYSHCGNPSKSIADIAFNLYNKINMERNKI